ncbi:protein with putative role during mitosis [Tulasnella sp. 417]|nr:protein with putative role during mitosis [Tulasnella sp. 417]
MTARCRELSASLDIPNVAMSIPWSQPPFPSKPLPGQAIEEVARAARSQLLFDAMQQHQCDVLVMGHHADDQVETVLMRLLRRSRPSEDAATGSEVALHTATTRPYRRWGMGLKSQPGSLGWAGLPGMDKWIIRPLLSLPKDSLIATCTGNNLDYVEDVTNFNPALTPRNAVRAALADREEASLPVKVLSEADVCRIQDAVDKARSMALTSQEVGPPAGITTADTLRAWVGELEKARENLDSDVDRLLSRFSASSPPSTFLLRTDLIIKSNLNLSKSQKHALIRRILRFVSPRAWGSSEAEAGGRTDSLERISQRIFRGVESNISTDTAKFGAGADVLWKPVVIGNDGRIEPLRPGSDIPKQAVGWLAYRSPPRAAERNAQVDITSAIHDRLANPESRKEIELFWDCRFALTLKPWLLSDDVKSNIDSNPEDVSVTVEAGGEWMLPRVVLRQPKGKSVLGGYSKRHGTHRSILDYLHSQNFGEAFNALQSECGIQYTPDPKAKYNGLLEKKWTSVIRLQKKIMDLENRNALLTEELNTSPGKRAASQADWVPRAPPRHVLTGHRGVVNRVTFHPVFSLVVSASEDSTVKVWDWETGEFERTLKGHTRAVHDVDFDPKGDLLVSCSSDLTLKLWDVQNEYKNIKTLVGHDHVVSTARFMPSGDLIVSASRDTSIRALLENIWRTHACNDHTARIWDAQTGEVKMDFLGHENVVEVAIFAPIAAYPHIRELAGLSTTDRNKAPGLFVATGGRDKLIKLWDATSGQVLRNLAGHTNWVRALVFHPTGKFLLSAADDYSIRVWDLKTGRCTKVVDAAHSHFVGTMTWGRALVSGAKPADGTAKSADDDVEKKINVLATGSVDLTVKIWTP